MRNVRARPERGATHVLAVSFSGTGIAPNPVVNETLTKYRTKLELLQALARRQLARSRMAVKTRVEPEAELRLKVNSKAVLASV